MPKLKRKTSHVSDDAIFKMYDGPMPPRGVYPGVITNMYISKSSNENDMINVSAVFETKGVEGKEKYDGFRVFGRVVLVDKEANIAREKALYRAIAGKEDIDIDYIDLDAKADPGKVRKIGGVNPIGKKVKLQIVQDNRGEEYGMTLDYVLPLEGANKSKVKDENPVEDDDDDDEVDADEDTGDDEIPDYESMSLPAIRKLAKSLIDDPTDYDVDFSDISKASKKQLVALLDEYYEGQGDEEDEDEDEDEDEEDEEEEDTSPISSENAKQMSLDDLIKAGVDAGIKKKRMSGMNKKALITFLKKEGLISDKPPF